MKHRINVSLALLLSCVLGASSSLAFASNINLRTASRKTDRAGLPRHERLKRAKPVQTPAPEGQTTTLLPDGRLLLVGGIGPEGTLSTASLSDPLNGQTLPLANIREARAWHSATVLPDGRVFIFGGTGANGRALNSVEIFDPATLLFQSFSAPGLTARAFHSATLLMDGKVLFAGGVAENGKTAATIETWDFKSRKNEVLAARLNVARQKHKASLLADGRILIEAGVDETGNQVAAIEAFSPETKEFTLAGPVAEATTSYLVASAPANDATDVPVETIIALRFSTLLAPRSVNADTVVLNNSEGRAYAKVVAAENGRMVFVTPFEPLTANTTYTLTVDRANDGTNNVVPATVTFTTAAQENKDTNPPDQPDWIPDANGLRGDWTSKSPKSPWEDLPRLEAEPGVTALSGQALTLRGQPLANVTLEINGNKAVTDNTGRFLLKSLNAGRHVLKIDGGTATHPGGKYGFFRVGVDIAEGKTNTLTYTIWLPKLDMANAVTISSPTTSDLTVTTPRIPGLQLRLPAKTVIHDVNGQTVTQLSITPIPTDRPPFPLPAGVYVPVFFTVQPGASRIYPPRAQVVYPNFTNSAPGTRIDFWNYDPEVKGWYVYGQGTVVPDGSQIMPDPNVVLYAFNGTMVATPTMAPPEGPKPCNPAGEMGDPVDASTGLYVYTKTDFVVPDVFPIDFTRTYRTRDQITRPFGIGASHSFEMFIVGTTWPYTFVDLILPDGGRVHYDRVTPGTSFSDAIYEHTGGPSPFYKSRIRWIGGWELKLRDGSVYIFPDGENQIVPSKAALIGIRDRHGNALTLSRNGDGDLTKITTPNGRFLELTYDTSHRITKAKDNIGREILYAYDASGRLQQVTELNLGTTKYTSDTSNRMLSVEDPRGVVYVINQYDANGRVIKQTLPDDTPANPNDNPTHQYSYVTNGAGKIIQTDYTDPRGVVRRTTLNDDGFVTAVTYAQGTTEQATITYERQAGSNLLAATVDPRGRRTAYVYDTSGNIISITRLQGTADAITTTYEYEPLFNNLTRVIDPLGRRLTYSYDSLGNLTSITDAQGDPVSMTYNSKGQVLTLTDPLNRVFRFDYEKGDLVKVTDPAGRFVTRFVDGAGRLLGFRNALGKLTRFEYDVFNQLSKVIDPLNGTTEFTRDVSGRVTQIKDPRNKIITYTYDNLDRVVSRTDALQGATSVEQYEYDKGGNVTKITDRRGKVTVYTYDNLERRTFAGFGQVGAVYESTINYTYDNGNRFQQIVDSLAGTMTFNFDEFDSLTSTTTPQGTVTYTNDEIGRRESMSVPGQATTFYSYNDADDLTSITRGADVVTFVYDAADQLIRTVQPNGATTDYDYDLSGRLTGITYKLGSTVLGDLTYQYDAAGRRTVTGGTFARTNLPQPFASATYNDANRLTQKGAATFTYDANGNLTSDGTNTYTWNARNQLASISGPSLTASFQYDAFGRRVNKTINGASTSYLYDDFTVVKETSSGPTVDFLATGWDKVFSRTDGSGSLGFLTDGLGSTLALTDSSGVVQTSYTYDPFGNTTAAGGSSNTTQFTGRENDATGLYFYRSRYYSPVLQRFISEDPIGIAGGINLYAYVANDPVNFSDPLGRWPTRYGYDTHQESAKRVLQDRLSAEELKMLQDSIYEADADEYQDAPNSHRHAMTPGDKSKTEARKKANDFVRDNLEKAQNATSAADKMKYLGLAMHAMQDATSPAHAGFRKYYGGRRELYSHVWEELFDPGAGSNLDNATEMAYKYYKGELPMPKDFFENLCADKYK
ncbi:MAG TPA: RHS repeat-associated core domain-containing protein [Pyrinomonadaceae bacterium]|nr:RHS repeat-associated core domain-containing protein [Pyrinomonadaceae bacterium]